METISSWLRDDLKLVKVRDDLKLVKVRMSERNVLVVLGNRCMSPSD